MSRHDDFVRALKRSTRAQFLVAQMLHHKGETIEISGLQIAPTFEDAEDYADSGDLQLLIRKRIEVKHSSRNFTSRHDWPLGGQVFIDTTDRLERVKTIAHAYYTVSSDFRHFALIKGCTEPCWFSMDKFNKRLGIWRTYRACELGQVEFGSLEVKDEPDVLIGNPRIAQQMR